MVTKLPELIRGWTPPFHVSADGIKDSKGCWICSASNGKLALQLTELMNFAAATPDHASDTVDALTQAESFISGFEDDPAQKGVADILAGLRAAIPREQARPDLLAVLKLAVTDWPQFGAAPALRSPGCQPEDDVEVNGGDLVEWFGNWRRAFVLPAIANAGSPSPVQAAAPDTLAALKAIKRARGNCGASPFEQDACNLMDAAIAKAEGQANG
ncbi:hypothetical protein NKJ09_22995 [Mesorhizobium sp. M0189]|uniref:hypothetical protein n=1 Tax=Mesorhizobium sp. M0189 TaxID=2956909 RepID=UPI00333BC58E